MLSVCGLSASYGAIRAVHDLNVEVGPRQFVAILGANGAGKSTTLRSIAGLHRPVTGTINLAGKPIGTLAAHKVVQRGLALVPEGRMVVAPLTVEENLKLSRFAGRGNERDLMCRVYDLFPRLKERRWQRAGLMSGGEQQMLAIGRALMTEPQLLVLDEPSMGLAPSIVELVFDAIDTLPRPRPVHPAGGAGCRDHVGPLRLRLCDEAGQHRRLRQCRLATGQSKDVRRLSGVIGSKAHVAHQNRRRDRPTHR